MKVAHILPVSYLHSYSDYHLSLVHLIYQIDAYCKFYAERSRKDFVILDNSAHENSRGEAAGILALAATILGPQEVVLPDVLFDSEETVKASTLAHAVLQLLGIPLMVVPQGKTFDEWRACLDGLLPLNPSTIGVSKDFETWFDSGLVPLIEYLLPLNIPIHLLGWGRKMHLLPDYVAAGNGKIRGVDSAKPAVYAYAGIELPENLSQAPPYPERPKNFFILPKGSIDLSLLTHNLTIFQKAAGAL